MVTDFLDDIDKMYDFLDDNISKEEFLQSYSYLTEEEYTETLRVLNENAGIQLAYLMRRAENMLIEENTYFDNEETNPYAYATVTGEQFKSRIAEYVENHLTDEEKAEFQEMCESMAC